MTLTGSCMCGTIAYSSSDPVLKALCHCLDCQKWTGGAFTSNVVVPRDGFSVTKGTPKTYDVVGESGKNNKHFFCGNCGSSLYTELDLMADKTVIKAGTLDGGETHLGNSVDVELYSKDRVSYLLAVEGAMQAERMA
ncbi:Glutathione-dependent formaldehyde-activating enzyme [Aspergillus sp. HF37]|nr:Glutathione-dependent formaldehyde-activating enzyme [Aspergillus sp. HF37]